MSICHYDWFNKQADGPIAEQDKIRWKAKMTVMERRNTASGETPADTEETGHVEKI